MYICVGFMALITAMVLFATSQDSVISVSVRRAHVVFSTAEITDGEKPCHKARKTTALQRGIQKASFT